MFRRLYWEIKDVGAALCIAAAMLAALALLSGCKSARVVEVERVRLDTCYISREKRDSIVKHDSIYVHEWTRGDTVFVMVDKWHTMRERVVTHDTIYKARVDSVPVPYEVVRKVPRGYSWWDRTRFWALYVLLAFVVIYFRRNILCVIRYLFGHKSS